MWKQRLPGDRLTTLNGESVEVLSAGMHNGDAGPDFLNARLRIAGQLWAGSVEIHVRASDWYRHGHDSDPAYDNVVLHVVAVDDARVCRADGSEIPQTLLTFPSSFLRMYDTLSQRISAVPCEPYIAEIDPLRRTDWLATLATERLQEKARRILDCAASLQGDWNRTCFVTLARALGFSLNGDPFEMLARSVTLNALGRHSDNMLQLEALLFGQAGMLDTSRNLFDEYYQTLGREYIFLARKYGLRPMNASLWKYARTRPQNFPHRRIALLCRTLPGGFTLLGDLLERQRDSAALRALLDIRPDGYWKEHSAFGVPGHGDAALSPAAISLLMINFTAPMLYAYAAAHGDPDLGERAAGLWEESAPENNTYTRQWSRAGLKAENAADTQALLQLRKRYCDAGRCLDCRFCGLLLRRRAATSAPPAR